MQPSIVATSCGTRASWLQLELETPRPRGASGHCIRGKRASQARTSYPVSKPTPGLRPSPPPERIQNKSSMKLQKWKDAAWSWDFEKAPSLQIFGHEAFSMLHHRPGVNVIESLKRNLGVSTVNSSLMGGLVATIDSSSAAIVGLYPGFMCSSER